MELVHEFGRIGRNDADIAGGKGASLGEMTQAGIPVPPGYVVLSSAFERFIEETDLNVEIDAILGTVKHEEMHTVEHASATIQDLILKATMPEDIAVEVKKAFEVLGAEFVAVRSSATAEDGATAAWAGQLDTFLNTTEATLLENVQRCWASLFTPRAIFYRFEKELHTDKISVAVVVQKMVNSDAAGIAFSVHPVTEDYNQLIIEAGFGLGEAVVSGQITPDSYVVTKSPREILDKNLSEQEQGLYRKEGGGNEWRATPHGATQVLSDEQILTLSETLIGIEKHYGFPVDTEWAMEGEEIYITQSRPITTLSTPFVPDEDVPESLRMEYVKMGRWAMLPADVETWHTEHTSRYFKEYFGIYKDVLPVCILGKDFYNIMFIGKPFIERLYATIDTWLKEDLKAVEKKLIRFYDEKKQAHAEVPAISAEDYSALSSEELIALYRKNRDWVHRVVVYDQFGWIVEDRWNPILESILTKKLGLTKGTPEYNDTLFKLIKPREISTTLEEKRDTIAAALSVKQGTKSIEEAITELTAAYAWVPVLAFGTPWNEDWYRKELPGLIEQDEAALARELELLRDYTALRDKDFADTVTKYGISEEDLQPFIDFGLLIDTRNEAEYLNSLCGFYLLSFYDEFSRRLGISIDEVRTLYEEELVACIEGKADARTLLAGKSTTIVWGCTETGRVSLVGAEAEAMAAYAEAHSTMVGANAASDEDKGVPASPGKATGIARIIPTPSENDRVGEGDILITFATTVDYLPSMKKAAAIVTEVGGLTCHAAVVSREFGIPCVVGLKGAMTKFKDGDIIEVDADAGIVRIVGGTPPDFSSAPSVPGADGASGPRVLSKIFTRERPLFYFMLWHDADRTGLKELANEELKHDLFILPPRGEAGSVWYSSEEFNRLADAGERLVNGSKEYWQKMLRQSEEQWELLKPYLVDRVGIRDAEDFSHYYKTLVTYWGPMNSPYFSLPDRPSIDLGFRDAILALREKTQDYTETMNEVFVEYFERAFPDLKHLAYFVLPHEVMVLERDRSPEFVALLEKRAKEGCFILEGTLHPLPELDTTLRDRGLAFEKLAISSDGSITGQTAYKGIVRGTVRRIMTKTDMERMQPGEILVAPMTDPNHVPAMKIAGAVITDEGGMTCHAAIASRELKVPCVVGTKVATQVLKDGDLVEVDAGAGIVTILSA